jgi:hypothetical protein
MLTSRHDEPHEPTENPRALKPKGARAPASRALVIALSLASTPLFVSAAPQTNPATTIPPAAAPGGILLPGPSTPAQDRTPATGAAGVNVSSLTPPSAAVAMDSFSLVRAWVNAGGITPPASDNAAKPAPGTDGKANLPAPRAAAPRVHGAIVELRLGPRVVGRAEIISELDQSDSATTLARATEQALRQASRTIRLDDPDQAKLAALGQTLSLSVEIAGPLLPMELDTSADLDATLSPGVMGIALSVPGAPARAMFPSRMLAQGERGPQAMLTLTPLVTGDPASALLEPRTLRLERKVTLYFFRAMHVAQLRADLPGVFLHRGQRLVDQRDLDSRAELLDFLSRAGQWLNAHAATTNSTASSEALTALALVRAGSLMPGPNRWGTDAIARLVQRVPAREVGRSAALAAITRMALLDYRPPTAPPTAPNTPTPTTPQAAVALALSPEQEALRVALIEACDASLAEAARAGGTALATNPRPQAGAVAWARRALATSPQDAARADEITTALLAGVPAAQLVSAMPWLGWADLRRPEPAPLMQEMLDTVWDHQLSPDDTGEADADFAGGIVFTSSKNPLPNWHAARPLAFAATALRYEQAVPVARRPRELVRLLSALRFFRQLQIDDSAKWRGVDDRDLGGVRTATWEMRPSDEATAMTLLCLVETIRSLDALSSPSPAAASPAPAVPKTTTPPPAPTTPADRRNRPQDR